MDLSKQAGLEEVMAGAPGMHLPHDCAALLGCMGLQLLAEPPEAAPLGVLPQFCQYLLRMHIGVLPLTACLLPHTTPCAIRPCTLLCALQWQGVLQIMTGLQQCEHAATEAWHLERNERVHLKCLVSVLDNAFEGTLSSAARDSTLSVSAAATSLSRLAIRRWNTPK